MPWFGLLSVIVAFPGHTHFDTHFNLPCYLHVNIKLCRHITNIFLELVDNIRFVHYHQLSEHTRKWDISKIIAKSGSPDKKPLRNVEFLNS